MWIIHLFLLLSQLLSVSGSQTPLLDTLKVRLLGSNAGGFNCKTKQCKTKKSRESVELDTILAPQNLALSDTYCCRTSRYYCGLKLKVVKGCVKLYFYDVEFSQDPKLNINMHKKQDCANACLNNQSCHYFTFNKRDKNCFLMAPIDPLTPTINKESNSGYFHGNCCTNVPCDSSLLDDSVADDDAGLQFHSDTRSWFDALGFCHTQSSTLAELTNRTVEDDVAHVLQNETNLENGVWVGLERSIFGASTTWRWISGENVESSQWNSSTAPSSSNKYCGKMIWVNETKTIKLVDDDCFKDLPFICQDPA